MCERIKLDILYTSSQGDFSKKLVMALQYSSLVVLFEMLNDALVSPRKTNSTNNHKEKNLRQRNTN